jgi:hypothetical protein
MPLSRNLPKNSHVLWLISLIQDTSPGAQTKAEFAAMTADILSNEYVDKITICVGDTLQRFRFMIRDNCSEDEAIEKCHALSNQWYLDNPESLEKLKASKQLLLIKWDEFLAWPDREKTVQKVEDLYRKDEKFRRDVDGRIKQEMAKYHDAKITNPTRQTELLKKYLFEESAFLRFAAEQDFKHVLYKMPFPPAIKRVLSNSDFVAPGFMVEVNFTQFKSSPKPEVSNEKAAFQPVLSHALPSRHKHDNKSPTRKVSEFIESAIELLSDEQKTYAVKALIEFTNQQIIPLSYKATIPTLSN